MKTRSTKSIKDGDQKENKTTKFDWNDPENVEQIPTKENLIKCVSYEVFQDFMKDQVFGGKLIQSPNQNKSRLKPLKLSELGIFEDTVDRQKASDIRKKYRGKLEKIRELSKKIPTESEEIDINAAFRQKLKNDMDIPF